MPVETTNKNLSIPSGRRSLLYQTIVQMFRNDPTLKRVISDGSWHTQFGDDATDAAEFGQGELPAVRILPFGQGASPESNTRQNSPLGISITIATDGLDVLDALDLWECFEAVVFTGDGGRPLVTALQGVVPSVYGFRLMTPAVTPNPEDMKQNVITVLGTITIDMQVRK